MGWGRGACEKLLGRLGVSRVQGQVLVVLMSLEGEAPGSEGGKAARKQVGVWRKGLLSSKYWGDRWEDPQDVVWLMGVGDPWGDPRAPCSWPIW